MRNTTKIQNISRLLQYGCYFSIVLGALFGTYLLWKLNTDPRSILHIISPNLSSSFERFMLVTGVSRVIITLLMIIPPTVMLYSYWRLSLMFKLFSKQNYFDEEGAQHLFVFALINLILHFCSNLIIWIADIIAGYTIKEPAYGLSIEINGDEISKVILLFAFVVISWIIREGVLLRQENEEFL